MSMPLPAPSAVTSDRVAVAAVFVVLLVAEVAMFPRTSKNVRD
jgi:hypothetical protein